MVVVEGMNVDIFFSLLCASGGGKGANGGSSSGLQRA